jgi:hypothetical protein
MDVQQLVDAHPRLYHMAEDGTWPSIQVYGLLSTQAIVDRYRPPAAVAAQILTRVRRDSITLQDSQLGSVTIRDQRPLKFLSQCLADGTTEQQFLDELNGRVFFWVTQERLAGLLGAKLYRDRRQTVLHVDTEAMLRAHGTTAQLAPYNTGSMHVPNAPKRGVGVFLNVADYPYDEWRRRRGASADAVVELTVNYAVPDIVEVVTRVELWTGGAATEVLFDTGA